MSSARFDDLARSLASGVTRRAAVKAVAGSALAAVGLATLAGDASASHVRNGEWCASGGDCRSGCCLNNACRRACRCRRGGCQ